MRPCRAKELKPWHISQYFTGKRNYFTRWLNDRGGDLTNIHNIIRKNGRTEAPPLNPTLLGGYSRFYLKVYDIVQMYKNVSHRKTVTNCLVSIALIINESRCLYVNVNLHNIRLCVFKSELFFDTFAISKKQPLSIFPNQLRAQKRYWETNSAKEILLLKLATGTLVLCTVLQRTPSPLFSHQFLFPFFLRCSNILDGCCLRAGEKKNMRSAEFTGDENDSRTHSIKFSLQFGKEQWCHVKHERFNVWNISNKRLDELEFIYFFNYFPIVRF